MSYHLIVKFTALARNTGILLIFIVGSVAEYFLVPCIFIFFPIVFLFCFVPLPNSPQFYLFLQGNAEVSDEHLPQFCITLF